jgi:FMN-binding protein
LSPALRLVAIALVLTAVVGSSASAKVFHAKDEALALAFPEAEHVEPRVVILTDAQKSAIEKLARTSLDSQLWTVYLGWRGTELLGSAVIDSHVVRTLPETSMVVMAPDGRVRRVEILAFHEPLEYLPTRRWMDQFAERALDDDLRLRAGIQGITGATLSATAMTAGVRRVLALRAVLVRDGVLPER